MSRPGWLDAYFSFIVALLAIAVAIQSSRIKEMERNMSTVSRKIESVEHKFSALQCEEKKRQNGVVWTICSGGIGGYGGPGGESK